MTQTARILDAPAAEALPSLSLMVFDNDPDGPHRLAEARRAARAAAARLRELLAAADKSLEDSARGLAQLDAELGAVKASLWRAGYLRE